MKKCYLCGSTSNLTRDHIPPKGFFVPPLPDNLITVPCCDACNQEYKKDDEAARVFFSAYRWQSDKGFWVWENKSLQSTLKRSPKLTQQVWNSIVEVPVQTRTRVEMMSGILFPVERMNRFLIRITKGLLFTFYPQIDSLYVHFKVNQINPSQEVADFMSEKLIYDERGDGAFRFWRLLVTDDPKCHGVWSYVFYDGLCFVVVHSKDKKDLTSQSMD